MKEVRYWAAYIQHRGSLNYGRRFEQELAKIHHSLLALKGVKNVSLESLMSHEYPNKIYDVDDQQDENSLMMMVGK